MKLPTNQLERICDVGNIQLASRVNDIGTCRKVRSGDLQSEIRLLHATILTDTQALQAAIDQRLIV